MLVEWGILQGDINDSASEYAKDSVPSTISSSIQQIATQLEQQFSKLGDAYKEIFKLDDNGKEKFNLSAVDNSMLEDIRQSFAEIKDEIGVTFDTSKLEPFFDTLTNGDSTAEQVQQAFNDLATAYLYSTDTLDHLNSETADAIALQLEELGVQNAAEIVADELKAKTEELIVAKEYLAQTGKELSAATEEERTAFILEQIEAGNCGEALALLQLKKMLVNGTLLDTSTDINNVLALAQAAGIATDALTRLQSLKAAFDNAQATGNYGAMNAISAEMSNVKAQIESDIANFKPVEIQFDSTSAEKSAKKAGKGAADAYLKAFQKELQEWKDLESQGKISHKQYLDALLRLVKKYFGDRKKYAKEYAQYMNEYLQGYLDLYNKALSGISTLLNRKISSANEAKDATISALQEEKEKAAEVYQSQIDNIEKEKEAIDDLIKEKNKKIDSINEEIEAIKRAAETRKKNINLQQQEYNLQNLLNQRTIRQYSEEKGIHYVTDDSAIRDAQEKVKEAQDELKIDRLQREADLIQKEIDLLEEKKDSLTEQQDRIQKLMDESNKYYDNLIKQQEKMWDSMIKDMEQTKSRYEELAEVEEVAKAFSYIQQVFGDLGYTVEDVLNGSDTAFEDFKSHYISLISDVNSNSDFTEGLVYASGVAKEQLGSFLDKTKETAEGLDDLGAKASELDTVAEGMGKLSDSVTTASKSTGEIASNMGELNTNTQGLSDNLSGIGDALTGIPEADKFDTLATSFTNLGEAIQSVADVLGIGGEGAVSTLVSALQEISTLSLDGAGSGEEGTGSSGKGIISQFNNLKTAVEDVTNAISGGGSSGGKVSDASSSSSPSMSAGAGGEDASGLIDAIEEIKPATDEALVGGEGKGSEGGGTGAIGQFEQLKTAVDDVTAAIGSEDSEGGKGADSTTLISALRAQYEKASETVPKTKALFDELLDSIMSCVSALNNMVSLMSSMPEMGGTGGVSVTTHADGAVDSGHTIINGQSYTPISVAEFIQELRDKQTLRDRSDNNSKLIKNDQVNPNGKAQEKLEKTVADVEQTLEDMKAPTHIVAENMKRFMGINTNGGNTNNVSSIVNNNKNVQQPTHNEIHVTLPNVTNATSAESLLRDLQSLNTKKYQVNW